VWLLKKYSKKKQGNLIITSKISGDDALDSSLHESKFSHKVSLFVYC
jgi:hypothetical protein